MGKGLKLILAVLITLSMLTASVFAGTELTTADVAVMAPANAAPGINVTAGAAAQTVNVTIAANDGNIPASQIENGWVSIPSSFTISDNRIITVGQNTVQRFAADQNFSQANQALIFPIQVTATSGAQAGLYEIPITVGVGPQINLASGFVNPKLYVAVAAATNQENTKSGFLSPLKDGATYKIGRVIPIKFIAPAAVGTASIPTAFISLEYKGTVANTKVPDTLYCSAASKDNLFRYDSVSKQYIYNLNTKNLAPGEYLVKATLSNDTSYSVMITLEGNKKTPKAPTLNVTPKKVDPVKPVKATNKK